MQLFDQHLHSRHSFDSRTEPIENVRTALAGGLAGLTFTEHFDTHPSDWEQCVYDDGAYTATIQNLRNEFGGQMFIGKGIEVCFQPARMDFVLDFLSRHTFDLVILSVHYFGEKPVHKRETWQGLDPTAGTRAYLEAVRDAVRECVAIHKEYGRVFDVLGHLDLAKRYTQRYFGSYDVGPCGDVIDEILRACLAAELIPEINTSSLRQQLQEPMPGQATILRYAELGGKAMSLGSDAHRAEDVGAGFDYAASQLQNAQLKGIVFRDRKPELIETKAVDDPSGV